MASRALAVPLVHVHAGLLASEGGEAAAETTDGSQGEGNLHRMRMQRGGGGFAECICNKRQQYNSTKGNSM